MKHYHFTLFVLLLSSGPILAQHASSLETIKIEPFAIGETVAFYSESLQENRILNIYLPHGFSRDSARQYPVIYLLDGTADEDFIHIAGLVQFGSYPWIQLLPESIVVGIANVDRKRDFTFPTRNKEDKETFPTTGGSAPFIDFISQEVQPYIASHYPVQLPRTIIGQSLGGLLATEILFKQPDLFDQYIIVSPSLWWDDQSLLELPPKSFGSKKSVYVAVGEEGKVMKRDAKALSKKLRALDWPHLDTYFEFFKEQNHGDALHLAVYGAFEKIKPEGQQ